VSSYLINQIQIPHGLLERIVYFKLKMNFFYSTMWSIRQGEYPLDLKKVWHFVHSEYTALRCFKLNGAVCVSGVCVCVCESGLWLRSQQLESHRVNDAVKYCEGSR